MSATPARRKDAEGRSRAIAREQRARPALPQPPQVHEDARARGPARAAREPSGAEAPKAGRQARVPGRALAGRDRCGARSRSASRISRSAICRAAAGSTPTARSPTEPVGRASRRSLRRSGASGSASSGPTARARRRCCGRSRATCRRSTARSVRPRRPARLPRPAARGGDPGHDRARRPDRGGAVTAGRGARVPCALPVPWRRRVQGGPELSGGERSRLELALLGIQPRTCCCSTSRPTTSTSRPARRSRRS